MVRLAIFVSVTASLLIGCSANSNGPRTYPVSGSVTLDGTPLKSGDIQFVPESPTEAPDAGVITDGKFSLKAKAGRKKVVITASRDIPGSTKKGAMGEDITEQEQYLPPQYNSSSGLSETVKEGTNSFTFELKSASQ